MNHKIRIAVLLGELINPRMEKRLMAESSIADVHLISWDRGSSNMLSRPSEKGYAAHSILLKAKGDPIRRMIPYWHFIKFARGRLKKIRPDIIHAQNLDMLKIALWYKQKIDENVKIIYEIADLHKLLVDQQKNIIRKVAQRYLLREDRRCARYVDLLIVTSKKYYENYFSDFICKDKMIYMPNVPDLRAFSLYKHKVKNDEFTVGFIGAIRYKKQMRNLIEAGKRVGVKVLFAGVEYEPVEIEPLCKSVNGFEWYGKFDFMSEAAGLYERCDAIYSVYDADMENVKVALPNKLYESIYCEVPIIVARGTYLAELVEEWGVGVSVDHNSIDELVVAINGLKNDREYYDEIVAHCHNLKDTINLERNNELLLQRIKNMIQ